MRPQWMIRAWLAWVLVAAMAMVVTPRPAEAAPAPPAPPAKDTADQRDERHTVMLLTGDRVTYTVGADGRRAVTVQAAQRPGGATVSFSTSAHGDHYYVIPSDAQARVAAGALDRALFDIPLLVRDGQATADQPAGVILTYRKGTAAARDSAALPGASKRAVLSSINGAAVRPGKGRAHELWGAVRGGQATGRALGRDIARVSLDPVVRPALDSSVVQIGAPVAWSAGYRGEGVRVAVLDTGIDANHPDVAGRIVSSANFTPESSIADGHGHGTHVASTVAGNGAASAERFRGVAPAASLMVGKVLNSAGQGPMSQVIAGMEWAARNGARVVNLSLGAGPSDGTDPASRAVDALTAETGALFVIAAGNNNGDASVNAPGAASAALTVGATDKVGGAVDFSNRGPRRGDGAVKPELSAPGYQIRAARAAGTSMGNPYNANYTSANGTSMATPHVAGAAALLAQANPTWTAAQLKDALVSTAEPKSLPLFTEGAGWVDVRRAIGQGVFGPEGADFGAIPAPYSGTRTRTLEYRNDTTAPVTLHLAVEGGGWDGRALPTGAVSVSAPSLTVPAGAKGSVTLDLDPAPGDTGVYGGVVTAADTSGTVRLRTPFSYYKGAAYKLTIPVLDSRGAPAADAVVTIARLEGATNPNDPLVSEAAWGFTDANGVFETHVSGGVYDAYGTIFEWDAELRRATHAIALERPIQASTTLTLDARQARKVNPVLPETVNALVISTGTLRELPSGQHVGSGPLVPWENRDLYVTPTPAPAIGWFDEFEQWMLGSTQVQVRANGTLVPVESHPYFNGRTLARHQNSSLSLVYAGGGSPAELTAAGAAGKVALVRVEVPAGTPHAASGGVAWNAIEAARLHAASAGAAGIIAYIDRPNGVPMPVRDDQILALTVSGETGRALRAQTQAGPVTLAITGGRANPERVYQLRYQNTAGVPATAPVVDPAQLISYPARYHADREGLTYALASMVFGEHDTTVGSGAVGFWAPMTWTEYFGPADARLTWSRLATQQTGWGEGVAAQLESRETFRPGDTRGAEDWFLPPMRTGPADVPDGYPFELRCTFCREGNTFIAGWYQGDADPRHYEVTGGEGVTYRMFRPDGSQIPASALRPFRFTMPTTPGAYRLEADEPQRGLGTVRTLGQRITTSWTFQSAPQATPGKPAGYRCFNNAADTASCAFQPLIHPRYLTTDLDPLNRATAGQAFTFDVVAAPHRLTPGGSPATALTLSTSTNGGSTWQPATVTSLGGGRFRVTVTHPALSSTDGYVWLRTEASDAAGNKVTQTVERAYALKQGSTCRVSYAANSWATGFTANVQITNTGPTAVNGWTLAWAFPGDQRITSAWNGAATQNGKQVSVTNTASSPTIAPGASTSFGFQGTYTGTNTDPSTFTLNGGPCVKQ
ncbi:S8 family serine peptidase [Micromonospora sp. CPCC 206061]|uniref:S8 family serine peptidase n=1 Tax=Micromonospora sp. CPCC 206061 TaxID=3122410 RepID=UPI002FEF36E4